MMYTITQDDAELLARIAGGLNYNRASAPPGPRFPASVLTANADALGELVSRITAPHDQPPGDVVSGDPLTLYETRSIPDGRPEQVYSLQASADGRFSVEVSGSPLVTFAVGERGVFDPQRVAIGAGTAPPLPVKAGEWCTWKYVAESGGQAMRPQLLAP